MDHNDTHHSHHHGADHSHSHGHSHAGHVHHDDHQHHDFENEEQENKEEMAHFNSILQAFLYYYEYAMGWIAMCEHNYNKLPERHLKLIPNKEAKFETLRKCAAVNYEFIHKLLEDHHLFLNQNMDFEVEGRPRATFEDMDKVKTTLKQFVRDWSIEGKAERDTSYKPILDTLISRYPNVDTRHELRVLCPGAGLGRLCAEIASLGFSCQGNEVSYFMLLGSNFVLNMCANLYEYSIHPYIHQTSNVLSLADQTRVIKIPDVSPRTMISPNVEFSMTAGEFIDSYSEQHAEWDCVCTCFFIDTAKNIVEYIEVIYNILKPGGLWINLGPLLYHFADSNSELSVELTYEEVLHIARQYGFEIQGETVYKCPYTANDKAMMQVIYSSAFFVGVKTDKQV
eukprot:Phypoly_transcript_08109.p1 GENE.Phypoly_transcript_08109~~Phypoly_transcript_08109.p1  ORF type:complete len:397 (+),score=28.28 Phypoly_transcript_08109:270-1460(+)